jgi:hypothetical protein
MDIFCEIAMGRVEASRELTNNETFRGSPAKALLVASEKTSDMISFDGVSQFRVVKQLVPSGEAEIS